jgi:integrase
VDRSGPGHLFLKPSPTGVLGPLQGVKNRLAEFSRGIVTDANVAPMHGWRHRWKSLAIDAGIPQRVQDAILGHSARDVAGTYGDVSVAVMAREVERVPHPSHPRFNLT